MDVDRLLNLERRTGVKNDDIDDFTRKVDEVQAAIRGMVDGTVLPESIKIEGLESEEDKRKKEAEQAERRRIQLEKDEALRLQRKQQEKERWWAGAEVVRPKSAAGPISATALSEEEEDRRSLVVSRYTADYSKWGSWVPTDEASRLEEEQQRLAKEEEANKEFEKNNPDFCKQFVEDMEERKRANEKKQESADILRTKGNRFFQNKHFDKALEIYMDALKTALFDCKLLLNIAQAHIKLKNYEDGLEFLARTLYLEPNNVKALSRQAFVLGEQGQVEPALSALLHALQLDPKNADLLAQQKELHSVQQERVTLLHLQASPGGEGIDKLDALLGLLRAREIYRILPSLDIGLASATTEGKALLRAHARQCGLLQELLDFVKNAWNSGYPQSIEVLSKSLDLLAALLDEQRSSKVMFVDSKLYVLLKAMLVDLSAPQLPLIAAVVHVLHVLTYDDHGCVKAKQMVLSDAQAVAGISTVLGNLSHNLLLSFTAISADGRAQYLLCLDRALHVMKLLSCDAMSKDMLLALPAAQAAAMVCSLGSVLHTVLNILDSQRKSKKAHLSEEKVEDMVEQCMAALLGLTQKENMRSAFAFSLPFDGDGKAISAVSALIQVSKLLPHQLVNVIGVLMNASIAGQGQGNEAERLAVVREIFQQDGLSIALATSSGQVEDVYSLQKRVRRAGLLSRLVLLPEVQESLLNVTHYRTLCKNLHTLTSSAPADGESEKWKQEEKAVYVRILASLPLAAHSSLSALLSVGRDEHMLTSLMSIFPTPRMECHEITPTSVTLMPVEPIVTVLLGNAARCLIPYVDDAVSAKELFGSKKYIAVEKLICSMASCTDIRVRKNISILLAKACKGAPEVRERVSHFRGLQMMTELQNQF